MKRGTYRSETSGDAAGDTAEVAATWLLRREHGLAPQEKKQLDDWLAADARHAAALAEFESAWADLNAPRRQGHGGHIAEQLKQRRIRRARRRGLYAVAGMAAAAVIGFAMMRPAGHESGHKSAERTVALKPDRRVLPDGSIIELNAGADIEVSFTSDQRAVTLVRGAALFTVAKDAVHPFIVSAGGVRVRAVGTAFTVDFEPNRTDVLVTEGRVALESAAGKAERGPAIQPTYLAVGHQATIGAGTNGQIPAFEIRAQTPAQIAVALAWRNQRVEFTETPLGEAVELFNRHNQLQINLTEPGLRQRHITGICWTNNPRAFVRMLESGLNLSATTSGERILLSSP